MDVYDRLDQIIQRRNQRSDRIHMTKTFLEASEPCVLDMTDI